MSDEKPPTKPTTMLPLLAVARTALGAAALVVLGAAIAGEQYGDSRGPMMAGAIGVLILLSGFTQGWRNTD